MDINKIYCGDCVQLMKQLPDNFIDLTVTSPPYDSLRTYKGYQFDFENIAKELFRITKQGGALVWVTGDETIDGDESGTSFKQALFFKQCGFKLYDTMIYQKNMVPFPSSGRYYNIFEYMFVLSKGKPKTINLLKDRKNVWKSGDYKEINTRKKDGTIDTREELYNQSDCGVRFNIWKYNVGFNFSATDEIAKEHPAIFPEMLVCDHILSWSNEKDLIFDPMCGSGTTLIVSKQLGRNFLGFEISEEYVRISNERLKHDKINKNIEERMLKTKEEKINVNRWL